MTQHLYTVDSLEALAKVFDFRAKLEAKQALDNLKGNKTQADRAKVRMGVWTTAAEIVRQTKLVEKDKS